MASNQDIRLGDRLEKLDKEIRAWARVTRKDLLFRLASLNLEERIRLDGEVRLKDSIKYKVKKKNGDIESVAFSFARHGIFLERGVGRGRPKNSPQAKKAAKPWIKPVLPDSIEKLADIIAEDYADIAALNIRIVVPGIINTTIRK